LPIVEVPVYTRFFHHHEIEAHEVVIHNRAEARALEQLGL
jgi:hypothetical protein